MRMIRCLRGPGFSAVLALLCCNGALRAAEVFFDGGDSGASFSEAVFNLKTRSAVQDAHRAPAFRGASGVRTYDFQALYKDLGYPSPGYFGAGEEAVADLETYISKEDTFYKEINGYLRFYPEPYDWNGISPEAARGMVKNIDFVFSLVPPLPGDLVVFRGVDLKFRGNRSYETGEEFVDKGYVSTSVSYKVAKFFAVRKDAAGNTGSKRAVFAIYSGRPGEKGILIDQEEDEVILRHGLRFRVMAQKRTGAGYKLYLVQACGETCETVLSKDAGDFWENFKAE